MIVHDETVDTWSGIGSENEKRPTSGGEPFCELSNKSAFESMC